MRGKTEGRRQKTEDRRKTHLPLSSFYLPLSTCYCSFPLDPPSLKLRRGKRLTKPKTVFEKKPGYGRAPGCSSGGSAWESNPPCRVLAGTTGFEVQEGHQSPGHFRVEG